MPSEQKQTETNFFTLHFALKLKNTEMSDEEHSDSEFYYPEEQETAERKLASRCCRHFNKLKLNHWSGDTSMKS